MAKTRGGGISENSSVAVMKMAAMKTNRQLEENVEEISIISATAASAHGWRRSESGGAKRNGGSSRRKQTKKKWRRGGIIS
jgi:hypothetical protein